MNKRVNDYSWKRNHNHIANNPENVRTMKNLLNSRGPGFCLAKFRQVTLHLGTGLVHSCHHPSPHKIPLDKLGQDAMTLFNTPQLKETRRQMLNGERPSECDFCWRVEDSSNSENTLSDRHMKSIEPWAIADHDEITNYTGDEDIYPSYLEVDFSNVCNMRCTYCGPEFSSKWVENLKQHGPIKLLENTPHETWAQGWQDLDKLNIKNRDYNPYVDAFWKWWPEAYKHLRHYRITGGEPLMSRETFRSLDWFIENANQELDFSINSNLCVPDKLWDRFIDKLVQLRDSGNVGRITIFTSVEGWGERAEYARTGLDFELFRQRYEQLVALGGIRAVIMATYNIFSVTSFKQLLEWVLELKRKYNSNDAIQYIERDTGFKIPTQGESFTTRKQQAELAADPHSYVVGIDIPYLRHPDFLDARFVTNDLVEKYWIPDMEFVSQNTLTNVWSMHQGFEEYEYEKFYRNLHGRLYYGKQNNQDFDLDENVRMKRARFYEFITEKDRRDQTDFLNTFPEMTDFYNLCKSEASRLKGN